MMNRWMTGWISGMNICPRPGGRKFDDKFDPSGSSSTNIEPPGNWETMRSFAASQTKLRDFASGDRTIY